MVIDLEDKMKQIVCLCISFVVIGLWSYAILDNEWMNFSYSGYIYDENSQPTIMTTNLETGFFRSHGDIHLSGPFFNIDLEGKYSYGIGLIAFQIFIILLLLGCLILFIIYLLGLIKWYHYNIRKKGLEMTTIWIPIILSIVLIIYPLFFPFVAAFDSNSSITYRGNEYGNVPASDQEQVDTVLENAKTEYKRDFFLSGWELGNSLILTFMTVPLLVLMSIIYNGGKLWRN